MKLLKSLVLLVFVLTSTSLFSQEKSLDRPEKYRLGLDLGLNYNMAGLGYQSFDQIGSHFLTFTGTDGTGLGGYLGLRTEYISSGWWGVGLQIGYDNRGSLVTDESMSNKPEFDIYNSYLNIAPYLKFNELLFDNSGLYVGPIFGVNLSGEYDYDSKVAGQNKLTAVDAKLGGLALGAQLGINYDIRVTNIGDNKVFVLSPFFEASWLVAQKSASFSDLQDGFDDTWSTVTARLGITGAIDFIPNLGGAGSGGQYAAVIPPYEGKVIQRVVEESFPLIPYVFFDKGNQSIPSRYKLLTKETTGSFDLYDALDLTNNPELAGETATDKKLSVYHDIMNIYAQQMKDDEDITVELIGSAPDANDGEILASKIKDYLVNVHGIDANRITIKGQLMPRIPSGSSATPVNDKPLAEAENRRVEFVFNKPEMYQLLKVKMIDEYPIDNDILVSLNQSVQFSSWTINVTDGDHKTVSYGPFFNHTERVSPYELLKGKEEGDYTGYIEITQADGTKLKDEAEFSLSKEMDDSNIGERYTILFNYGQSDAIKNSEQDLRKKVAPRVGDDELLIISGHTDPIGNTNTNAEISLKRSNEAKDIFVSEFGASSEKVNNIITYGYGESNSSSTFNNTLPEGRMYNRNVTIDIIPSNK
jgi:outer membrane protein OmpA-like peptidoglycan-associated protein